jgi:hypothetical protein
MTVMDNSESGTELVMLRPSLHYCWHSFINPRIIASFNNLDAYLDV